MYIQLHHPFLSLEGLDSAAGTVRIFLQRDGSWAAGLPELPDSLFGRPGCLTLYLDSRSWAAGAAISLFVGIELWTARLPNPIPPKRESGSPAAEA
jgi:hypothetical protein